ncbi:MAG: tetratricopeptide repeat protein [Muribaculaceae bacterium]|nr:tetratricopeptide repeat protein [Muribaculaceae bacterium]
MKKVCLIASVLFVAVVSTACINNFAVQDLNNKAKAYADKGDYVQAIERLKSSIDLDPSFFETHYNLAVVYTQAEDYANAIDEYKKVIDLKPDMADSYYSLATAENNLAVDISQLKVRMSDDGSVFTPGVGEFKDVDLSQELSEGEKSFVNELYNSAVASYQKYLELNPEASDKADVEAQIKSIQDAQNPEKRTAIE